MFHFNSQCPHCKSDKGFLAIGISDYVTGEYDYSKTPHKDAVFHISKRQDNPLVNFSLCGTCSHCKNPIVAMCATSRVAFEEIATCVTSKQTTMRPIDIKKVYPEPTPPYSHNSLPEDVRSAFIDLQKMLQQEMQPHFIITGCRTILEAAVKVLGGEGNSLKKRIDDLRAQGIITAVLHDWASHVRLSGNDAAHDMKGSPQEAKELVEFTKVFLQFTFEMPSRIATVRATAP